jgi:hypothetical protein
MVDRYQMGSKMTFERHCSLRHSLANFFVLSCCIFANGCAQNVTQQPSSGFSSLAGRCLVLRHGAFLWRNSFDSGWFLYPPGRF